MGAILLMLNSRENATGHALAEGTGLGGALVTAPSRELLGEHAACMCTMRPLTSARVTPNGGKKLPAEVGHNSKLTSQQFSNV